MDPASYYSDLTRQYGRYGGAARAWHYGLWEPDVRTHQQSLLRSNEYLLRGLELGPVSHVLDLGFGSGGFAVWAARTVGCRVTAISLCADHVPLARELADRRGVGERCEFLAMDMDRLAFADRSFDVVTNQDTFCHASDKAGCLREILRVLRPGGSWRAIDFAIQEDPLSPEQEDHYRTVLDGFHIHSLASADQVERLARDAGFVDVGATDLTDQVQRSAANVLRACYLPRIMMRLHLDWTFFSLHPRKRRHRQGHVLAGQEYSRGLQRRYFRHNGYSATRPR